MPTRQPPELEKKHLENEPADHALGRSRGGFSTKIHLVSDSRGLPIVVDISPGQTHEATVCLGIIDTIRVASPCGRPKKRPVKLAGDKAYTSESIRMGLKKRGIVPVIPSKRNQPRNPSFDKRSYRRRNIMERCIGWMKEYRRIATRYEKLAVHYLGMLKLGMILRYLNL